MAITYEQAKKEAEKLIENEYQTITEVVELNDSWVFMGGAKTKGEVIMGARNVKINKETGELENFPIPPIKNLDELEKGVVIFELENK